MASSDLREELKCPICWEIYIDPVSLRCGHSFCQDCIVRQLLTQKGSGCYSCPQCKEESQEWPALHKNIALRNISERFLCESSQGDQQCSVHKLELKYYCVQDATCICERCSEEDHQGHQVETLDEASSKKKDKLKNVVQRLTTERELMESRAQSLEERKKNVEGKAAAETNKVTSLFRDLRRQLDDLEKKVLGEISINVEQVTNLISGLMDQLMIKKSELSRRLRDIDRELSNMANPLSGLQVSDVGDSDQRHPELQQEEPELDTTWISNVIQTGVSHITGVMICFYLQEPADISLDVDTAHNDLHISEDMRVASHSRNQERPKTTQRFQDYTQVLSSQSFSSGQHYWDVDVGGSEYWSIGVGYPSIDRGGYHSQIDCTEKAWCLRRNNNRYCVIHDSTRTRVPDIVPGDTVRVFLDYDAGRISFYVLSEPIQHLHTFTTTFTEPLHAALRLWDGCITITGGELLRDLI